MAEMSLLDILRDENYINANDATKEAIFNKYAPLDQNYVNANDATKYAIRQKFGVTGDFEEVKPQKQEKESFSTLREIADVPLQATEGLVDGIKMVADFFGANNPVSEVLKDSSEYIASLMSAQSKNDSAEISRIMAEAKGKGVWENVKAGLTAFATAPVDITSNAVGTSVPFVLAGLAAATGIPEVLAALGIGGAAISATTAGAIGAGTVGAMGGAGAVKGQIYEDVKASLLEQGVDEAKADEVASQAQAYNGKNLDQILIGAGLGALASSTGVEGALIKGVGKKIIGKEFLEGAKEVERGTAGRFTAGAAKEGATEFGQQAQQQVASNIARQREGQDVDTFENVLPQATFAGIAGAVLGGGTEVAFGAKKPEIKPKSPVNQELLDALDVYNEERKARSLTPVLQIEDLTGNQWLEYANKNRDKIPVLGEILDSGLRRDIKIDRLRAYAEEAMVTGVTEEEPAIPAKGTLGLPAPKGNLISAEQALAEAISNNVPSDLNLTISQGENGYRVIDGQGQILTREMSNPEDAQNVAKALMLREQRNTLPEARPGEPAPAPGEEAPRISDLPPVSPVTGKVEEPIKTVGTTPVTESKSPVTGQPLSTAGFIRKEGGIKDVGGEMEKRGLTAANSSGLIKKKGGMSIEDAAFKLIMESDYYPGFKAQLNAANEGNEQSYKPTPEMIETIKDDLVGKKYTPDDERRLQEIENRKREQETLNPLKKQIREFAKASKIKLDPDTVQAVSQFMYETGKPVGESIDSVFAQRDIDNAERISDEAWRNIESLLNDSIDETSSSAEFDKAKPIAEQKAERNHRMQVKRNIAKLKAELAKVDTDAGRRQAERNPAFAQRVNEIRTAIAAHENILSELQKPENVGKKKLSKQQATAAVETAVSNGGDMPMRFRRGLLERRKPADNRPYVAPPIPAGPSTERVAEANRIIEDRISKLEDLGKQGVEAAKAIRQALASGAFTPAQMELAFRMTDTIARLLGKSNSEPYVIQFQSKITGYYGVKWHPKQGKTDFDGNNKTLKGLISIALGDPGLKHTTAAHEAFHVLQDLFNAYDKEAASIINKAFAGAKTIDDIDARILNKLKSTIDPNTKQSFYAGIKREIEAKGINRISDQGTRESEFQAYVFQTLDAMADRGVPVTGLGAAMTRFMNFFRNFRKNVSGLLSRSKEPDILSLMEEIRTGERAAGLGEEGKFAPYRAEREQGDVVEASRREDAATRDEINATGDGEAVALNSSRFGKTVDAIKEFFDPFALIPDLQEFLRRRNIMMGSVRMSHDLGRRLADIIRKADKADSERAYEYLTTRNADSSIIQNEKVRNATVEAKKKINEIADTLLARGEITPEAYEKFFDQYLPRIYRYYEETGRGMRAPLGSPGDKGWAKARNENLSVEEREVLGEIKDPAYLVYVAISRPMRDLAMADYIASIASYGDMARGRNWILPNSLVEWPAGSGKKMSPYALKYMAEDIRATSLDEAIRTGNTEAANRIRNQIQQMEEMADAANRAISGMPSIDTKRYEKMPENRRYGILAGAYVDKAIYNDLVGTFMPVGKKNASLLEGLLGDENSALVKAQGLWKLGKTTLNPATQVTNFLSNGIALNVFGGVPFRRFNKLLRRYIQERLDNGPLWQEAQQYGITGGTMSAAELRNALRLLKDYSDKTGNDHSMITMFGSLRTYLSAGANLVQKAGDIYQESEVLFKMMKFIHAKEFEGMDSSAAVNAANDTMFDYSRVNPNIRWLRNAPIGLPFVTYYYKALPKFFETLVKNPLRFAPYVAMYYALPAMTMAAFDLDDDEFEALRKSAADYIRDNGSLMFLPYKDKDGNIQMVDVGKYFPWAAFTDPIITALKYGEFGKAFTKARQPLTPSGPMISAIAVLTTGIDPFTQKPVYNDHDTPNAKAAAMFSYLFNQAMPPVFGLNVENLENSKGAIAKIYNSLTENGTGLDRRGLPKPDTVASIASLFGFNITPLRADLQRASNMNYMLNQINQTKALATMTSKDQSMTPEKRMQKIQALNDKIRSDYAQLQRYALETAPALTASKKVREQ